jgi:predicted dehydrogenase
VLLAASGERPSPVRVGFIGVGGRGTGLLKTILKVDEVRIPAICDLLEKNLARAQGLVSKGGQDRPEGYSKGPDDFKRMLERDDLDAVIIATPWRWHIPMSVAAMHAGKYAGCEVGPASSVEECWNLVNTHKQTGTHCMLLENTCYRRNMMAVLHMCQQGILGELIHCEGGYLHDLRKRIVKGKGTGVQLPGGGDFRTRQNRTRNGDIYPTHGLGPLAKCLDINAGNRFVSIASFASKSRGLRAWTTANLGKDHAYADIDWAMGDVVTSVIQCRNGETVILNHDCALPRPKTFMWLVQGTKGIYSEEVNGMYIDGRSPGHSWEPFDRYQEKYEHPLWKKYLETGVKGGHNGSDFLELTAFVDCVRNNRPAPIDACDMATWMAVAPLSEQSIAAGGKPVDYPDFTSPGPNVKPS